MADINKNNLLYVPKIEPERNYKSDGRIPKENPKPTPFPEEPITDTPKDIYNDLAEVQELITLTGVPSLQFFNETIERLKKRLTVAFPTGEPPKKQSGTEEPIPHVPPVDPPTGEPGRKQEKKKKKKKVITDPPNVEMPYIPYDPGRNIPTNQETLHPWHVDREYGPDGHIITEPPEHEHIIIDTFEPTPEKPPKEGGGGIEEHHIHTIAEEVDTPVVKPIEVPNMFPNITNVVLNVVPPRSLVQIIQDNYARDTINLQNFYLQKLQLILQKYFQEMLTVMAECNVDDIDKLTQDFDGEYVTVGDPNMRHLRDSVCRSQIMRDQKERFIKKMFNVDNTMLHMNRWHVAEQEREAYYAESYGDSGSFLDSHANAILRDCRTQYDAAYNQSVYDMYKYLNSSCEALGDVLEMTSKEAQAKGQMLKKGVDIYKNKAAEEQKAEDERHAEELKKLQAQREANKDAKPMSMSGGKLSDKSHVSLAESNTLRLGEQGASGSNTSGGGSSPVGRAPGVGADKIPVNDWTKDMAVRCSQKCGIPADWLWAQWKLESSFDVSDGNYNCGGVTVPSSMEHNSAGFGVWHTADDFADYFASYILKYSGTGSAKTLLEYVNAVQAEGYCTEPPGQAYVDAVMGILGDTTVLSN